LGYLGWVRRSGGNTGRTERRQPQRTKWRRLNPTLACCYCRARGSGENSARTGRRRPQRTISPWLNTIPAGLLDIAMRECWCCRGPQHQPKAGKASASLPSPNTDGPSTIPRNHTHSRIPSASAISSLLSFPFKFSPLRRIPSCSNYHVSFLSKVSLPQKLNLNIFFLFEGGGIGWECPRLSIPRQLLYGFPPWVRLV